jgi:hypothetical protein
MLFFDEINFERLGVYKMIDLKNRTVKRDYDVILIKSNGDIIKKEIVEGNLYTMNKIAIYLFKEYIEKNILKYGDKLKYRPTIPTEFHKNYIEISM